MTVTAELHDGRVLEFPDGTSPEVVQRTVKKMLGVPEQPLTVSDASKGLTAMAGSAFDAAKNKIRDVALGAVEIPAALVTGVGGAALGGVAQAATSAYEYGREKLGGEKRTPGAAQAVGQEVSQKFTYQPRTETGKAGVRAASDVMSGFGALPAAAEKMREAEREATGGKTTATDIALGVLSAAPAVAGRGVGEKTAKSKLEVATKLADEVTKQRTRLYGKDVADATRFIENGWKISPHEIKAGEKGTAAGLVEGVASEKMVSDAISKHNQEVANAVARRDLGLDANERLTPEALNNRQLEAFKPYAAVADFGSTHNLKFKFDAPLQKELDAITNKVTGSSLAEERPTAATVQQTKRSVDTVKNEIYGEGDAFGKLSPAAAVELVKSLRERSADIYKKLEPSTEEKKIAQVQYEAANALEGMLERRLEQSEQSGLLQQLRDARKQLAKIHTYRESLNPETGNVSIRKLSGEKYKTAPFTEGLAEIRKFGTKYKDSSKPETQQRGAKIGTLEAGIIAHDIVTRPVTSALVAGRAMARPVLSSKLAQRAAIPSVEAKPTVPTRAAAAVASSKTQAAASSAAAERQRRKAERAKR